MSKARRSLLFVVLCTAILAPMIAAPAASGAKKKQVGVVVVHGDEGFKVNCVKIPADGLKGLRVLERTELRMLTEGFGEFGRAVCWLDGEGRGSDKDTCFPTEAEDPEFDDPTWGVLRQKPGGEPQLTNGLSSTVIKPRQVLYMVFDSYPQTVPEAALTTAGEACNPTP